MARERPREELERKVNSLEKQLARREAELRRLENQPLQLAETRACFECTLAAAPICVALTTLDEGRIVEVNAAYSETFGYSREELLGKTTRDLNLWTDPDQRARLVAELAEKRGVRGMDIQVLSKSGEIRRGLLNAMVMEFQGKPHLVSTFNDLTALHKAKGELFASERRYQKLVEMAPAAYFEIDCATGKMLSVNRAALELTGYTAEELLSAPYERILAPESLPVFYERLEAACSGREFWSEVEYEIITKEGGRLWVVLRTDVEMAENGPGTIRAVGFNITELRHYQKRLEKHLELEQVLHAVSTQLFGEPEENTGPGPLEALASIGGFAGAERCYVYVLSEDTSHIMPAYQWSVSGHDHPLPDLGALPPRSLLWLMDRMTNGGIVLVLDALTLPPEDAAEKDICQKLGARSLLLIPLIQVGGVSGFLGFDSVSAPGNWEEEAVPLVECAAEMFVNAMERRRAQNMVRQKNLELQVQSRQLEEVNFALRTLLNQRKEETLRAEQRLINNMEHLVLPYVQRLTGTRLDSEQQVCVNVIQANLRSLAAPFTRRLSGRFSDLTPREIEVANLVRLGAPTSEIARILSITQRAVEFHRDRLREKLGIKNKRQNLRAWLASME
jgi:PAS domain S-box-containing protein